MVEEETDTGYEGNEEFLLNQQELNERIDKLMKSLGIQNDHEESLQNQQEISERISKLRKSMGIKNQEFGEDSFQHDTKNQMGIKFLEKNEPKNSPKIAQANEINLLNSLISSSHPQLKENEEKNDLVIGIAQIDGAILIIFGIDSLIPQVEECILLNKQVSVADMVVFLNKQNQFDDEELLRLVELKVRELLSSYEFHGDEVPVIFDLGGEKSWLQS